MFQTKMRLAVAFLLLCSASFSFAGDTKFIHAKRNKKNQPVALEIATASYEKGNVKVDLVGVVHIADPAYYDQLNEDLSDYDALLYELVAEKGTVIKKGEERDGNILATIHKLVGGYLGLESQVSTEPGVGINYERKNFVHADMSMEELEAEMAKNGDDKMTLALSAILENMRKQNKAKLNKPEAQSEEPELSISELLTDPEGPVKIKRMMADMFDKMGEAALGVELTGYLIDKRNAAAMKVFDEQVNAGKTNLGIFYGAAHMADFEKQLESRGFKKTEVQWNTAWDIRNTGDNGRSDIYNQANELFKLFEGLDVQD